MGLFSKKKKCESCGQKLHASWDQCPYCGAGAAQAPQAPAPVMAAPMPSQGGKQQTMAINIGGSEQIVTGQVGSGWLVPLDGPQIGELFQLRAGRTFVGTSPDCDIVLRDPSISGRHAEISIRPIATKRGHFATRCATVFPSFTDYDQQFDWMNTRSGRVG